MVEKFDITDVYLRDDVYAWDTPAEMAAGIILAIVFVFTGPAIPLIAAGIATVLALVFVLWGTKISALITSQVNYSPLLYSQADNNSA